MGKLYEKFQQSAIKDESAIFDLAAADERRHRGYSMAIAGFDRFIIVTDTGTQIILLQAERYEDGHHHISVQGCGYVMYRDEGFMELLTKF